MDISNALPDNWKTIVAGVGAMITLAGLDFLGAICAKEWAERGRALMFLGGLTAFVVLFVVYARILQVAELSTVTIGWVVFLQVGLLLLDAIHYDVQMPRGKILAVVVILLLQVYLIAGPNGAKDDTTAASPPTSESISQEPYSVAPVAPTEPDKRAGRKLGPRAA